MSGTNPVTALGGDSGIALAVSPNVTNEVFRTAEKQTERGFVVLK
jgi:hypothetical protein